MVIRSKDMEKGWDVPERITIRNGSIRGSIRIYGLGVNGEAPKVRESSHHKGHTARAQAAAPRAILLEDLQIEADHRIPLYLSPGVTGVTVRNCTFTGWSASTTVYLDAESGGNRIEGCTFDVRSGREVMAVDGSATNTTIGNRFLQTGYGGIYLYRNCGEGGDGAPPDSAGKRNRKQFIQPEGSTVGGLRDMAGITAGASVLLRGRCWLSFRQQHRQPRLRRPQHRARKCFSARQ